MDRSDEIKELRKKKGLSQSKFSAKFGIPVRTLQQWEQGISAPPEYLVRMMAYIMLLEEKVGKATGGRIEEVIDPELTIPITEEYPEENEKKKAFYDAGMEYTRYCKAIELQRIKDSFGK